MRAGSLGWEAVQRFCTVSKTMLSDGAKFVISAYLDTAYTAEELLTFIACTESYGSYSGIVDASTQWFNKSLDKLNENQMDYLAYAFANTAPSFDDFAELYPDSTGGAETAEAFGFQQIGTDPYWLLKKEVRAELDINPTLWFFACHFPGDPVMPGCLGLDAMWQLVGFFLGWRGGPGKGRALGVSRVKFKGEVLDNTKLVEYVIDIKRIIERGSLIMGVADGKVYADGKHIYTAEDLQVGLVPSKA